MLDPLMSLNNVSRSIKKFFIDGPMTTDGVLMLFGKAPNSPPTQGGSKATSWVGVEFGGISVQGYLAILPVYLRFFVHKDIEYAKLYGLRDTVTSYLFDYSKPDPQKRIALYEVSDMTSPIGYAITYFVAESDPMLLHDDTATMSVTISFQWVVM